MPETEECIEVLAEGRLALIDLPFGDDTQIEWQDKGDHKSPVMVTFFGDRGFFIRCFDHRVFSRYALRSYGPRTFRLFFDRQDDNLPCLVSFRKKNGTQYLILADIGTEDIRDGGEKEKLILTRSTKRDRAKYKIIHPDGQHPALHKPTKICLCEPKDDSSGRSAIHLDTTNLFHLKKTKRGW